MAKVAPWAIALLQTAAGISYIWLIFVGKSEPAFMTWFVFFLAVSISLTSYLLHERKKHGWRNNICNSIDVLYVPFIMASIAIHNGWKIFSLSEFEIYCLIAVICLLGGWFWTKNHFAAFLAVQGIITVGYIPTIEKLVISEKNTESFLAWGLIGAANLIGMVSAVQNRQLLPFIYTTRAAIMIFIVMALMFKYS